MPQKPATTPQIAIPGIGGSTRFPPISQERLPTNTTTSRHAIHRWFNFIAGFAPEFVAQQCPDVGAGLLLDPFAGCGTSLVVAQNMGLRAVGFDPHPFFIRIARAKVAPPPTSARLDDIVAALQQGIATPVHESVLSDSAATFLLKLFEQRTLRQLLGARDALTRAGLGGDDLAFLLLSRVVDLCSTAQTDGIYKAPTSTKTPSVPLDAVSALAQHIRADILLGSARVAPLVSLYESSSEDMSPVADHSVDVIVTSPPYLNNFDFAEMTRMYLYFWGMCASWKEITQVVRSKLLVNTTTALAGQRDIQDQYRAGITTRVLPQLEAIVEALTTERRSRAGKKEYDLLVYPYFAQMTRVIEEAQRCLRPNAQIHIVVADAAFYGIHVSTPQFLAEIMSALGFVDVHCFKLRARGHRWLLDKRDGSPIGLGEYHLTATRRAVA